MEPIAKVGGKGREMPVIECVDSVRTAFPGGCQQEDIVDGTASGSHGSGSLERGCNLSLGQRYQRESLGHIEFNHLRRDRGSQAGSDSTARQGGKTFRQGMGRGISIPGRGERGQCFLMTGFILDHRSQKTGAVEEVPHGRDSLVAAIAATASKVCPVRGTTISPDLRRSSGPGGSTGVSSNRLPTRANRRTDRH